MYLKNYLLTAGLAMTLSLNVHDMRVEPKIPEQQTVNIIDKEIQVKTGSGTCYENISRSNVERSLDVLCRKADREDAWLYWNNTLMDIGVLEDSLSVVLNEINIMIFLEKAEKHDTITIYHIHPHKYVKNDFSPPSNIDIWSHGAKKQQHTTYKDKDITIIQRMLNGSEMWEFDVQHKMNTNVGVIGEGHELKKERLKDIVRQIEYYRYNQKPDSSNILKKCTYNIFGYDRNIINEYIQAMAESGVILKYTPSDEL